MKAKVNWESPYLRLRAYPPYHQTLPRYGGSTPAKSDGTPEEGRENLEASGMCNGDVRLPQCIPSNLQAVEEGKTSPLGFVRMVEKVVGAKLWSAPGLICLKYADESGFERASDMGYSFTASKMN